MSSPGVIIVFWDRLLVNGARVVSISSSSESTDISEEIEEGA